MYKILIKEKISDAAISYLNERAKVILGYDFDREKFLDELKDAHALIVRSATKVTEDILSGAKNLRVVGRAGTGVDNIDIEAATKRGIIVVNTPDSNTVSAAEHTLGLIFALLRNIPQAYLSMKEGRWDRKRFQGKELTGKILGVIGFGRIGYEVSVRAKGLKMEVIAYDPYIPDKRFENAGIRRAKDLKELLSSSDIITIHVPKTKDRPEVIGEKEFEYIKEGAYLVNCARGGLINEELLHKHLKSGKIKGAALDVFSKEPPDRNALFDLPNVIYTPHLGASTSEAQYRAGLSIAKSILDILDGKFASNIVNIPYPGENIEEIKDFIKLAEVMGELFVQISKMPVDEVTIEYMGDFAEENTAIIGRFFLKEFLKPIVQDIVNYVNSPLIAKRRGINIKEIKNPASKDYKNLIKIVGTSGKIHNALAGTVLEGGDLRIVMIDGYPIDLTPSSNMLIITNMDRPGMIGKVGTILGKHHINIAGLRLGRIVKGDMAKIVLNLDDEVPRDVILEITQQEGIIDATFVKLKNTL